MHSKKNSQCLQSNTLLEKNIIITQKKDPHKNISNATKNYFETFKQASTNRQTTKALIKDSNNSNSKNKGKLTKRVELTADMNMEETSSILNKNVNESAPSLPKG